MDEKNVNDILSDFKFPPVTAESDGLSDVDSKESQTVISNPATKSENKEKRVKTMAKSKKNEIVEIEVGKLKPHQENELIYGVDVDVSDLVEKIVALGGRIIEPIKIKDDFTIISGHRRWKAAQSEDLNLSTVPCEIVSFNSPEEELAAIVLYNDGREKTLEQKTREGMTLEKTVMVDSYLRKIKALKQNQTDMDTETISEDGNNATDDEKGLTRDKVASAVKIGSGKTYDRAKQVIVKIDELKKEGKGKDVALLVDILNTAPATADKLLKVFDELTEDDKERIRSKDKNVGDFIKSDKEKKKPVKTVSYTSVMKEFKTFGNTVDRLKKSKPKFKTDEHKKNYREQVESHLVSLQEILKSLDDEGGTGAVDK